MPDDAYDPKAPFACAPGMKLEAHERLSDLRFRQLDGEMDRLEAAMHQLERRLWLTVFGVVGVILTEAFQSILNVVP